MDKYPNFSHLSVKDLVEARDQFHVHFMNKKNVVATAIGRYLIRLSDLDADGKLKPSPGKGYVPKPARTIANSAVINISWPCVLVFVDKWEDENALIQQAGDNVVPKTIYMPDGRVVPVCIVEAPKQPQVAEDIDPHSLRFPDNLIGGGFPLLMHSQGVDWVATVGCLVADGHRYYALTNKHVTGEGGEFVYSRFGASRRRVGVASGHTLGKVDFSRLYEGWISKDVLVNCDVGLVEIDDLKRWKTDVLDIGQIDELYNLNTQNFGLNLLTEHAIQNGKKVSLNGKVTGYGAVSGRMYGELLALFYRYESVGGKDYVSDFLICGRDGKDLKVHHGDSGTLWLLEVRDESGKLKLQPIALHWGQHQFVDGTSSKRSSYSLASCLSNVCRELEVEVIRDWNISLDYSWGKVGHYTVGTFAVDVIQQLITGANSAKFKKFQTLMTNNIDNISFARADVTKGLAAKSNPALSTDPTKAFCPLADVPDIIWKQSKKKTTWGRMGDENPNHYADADAPTVDDGNLFDISTPATKMTPEIWTKYYVSIDKKKIGLGSKDNVSQGLICFRVWQAFDYMVAALKANHVDKFIFAAGVLAHYVGDGCQPLHGSYMSNGDPADNTTIDYTAKRDSPAGSKNPHKKGDVYKKVINPGSGVHTAYEDAMIDDNIAEILKSIDKIVKDKNSRIRKEVVPEIGSGQEAGFAVLELMQKTQADIHPQDIVELFKKIKGDADVSSTLFEKFGTVTSECMARGCIYLESIWQAAWVLGNGQKKITSLGKVSQTALQKLYAEPTELPSKHLDTIGPLLDPPQP